jgi:hypothetical protein
MSWSVSAIGKASAVASSIAKQFSGSPCQEPEETVRQAAARTIAAAIEAQDPNCAVKVIASGSMGFKDYSDKTGPYNNVSIVVEPLHGFVE